MLFLQSSSDGGLDGGESKYLLTVEVKRLVSWKFDYKDDVLIFRQEYTSAFESPRLRSPANSEPSVIVVSQSENGACYFPIVAIVTITPGCQSTRRFILSSAPPTTQQGSYCVWSCGPFIPFQNGGVRMYSGKVDRVTIPEGSLALTGADEKAMIPCNAFPNAETDRHHSANLSVLGTTGRSGTRSVKQVCI